MRIVTKTFLATLTLFISIMVSAQAQAFEVDGLKYNVIDGTTTVEIAGRASGNDATDIVIPSSVSDSGTTYAVTAFARQAFYQQGITSVTIPDSITEIGYNAFYNSQLTSVTIPDSVTTIGEQAFYSNNLTSLIIPDSVTSIGETAFGQNTELTSVTIGKGVTTIPQDAFWKTGLTSVTIPDNVTTIVRYAFKESNLTYVAFLGDFGDFSDNIFWKNGDLATICTAAGASGWPQSFDISTGTPKEFLETTTCNFPPATPRKPVATRGNGEATVRWIKPDDSGFTITGYTVTSSGGQTCSTNDADTTSCVVTGLTNGTAYTFTVTATNAEGTSYPSPASRPIFPSAGPEPPSSPFAPVATAGDGQASVTWTKPADNGVTIAGYTVTSSGGQTCSTTGADTLTCVVTGLTNDTAYTFTVTANSVVGDSDPSPDSNSVTPGTEPAAPSAPVATAGDGQARVTWTKPADNGPTITSYVVSSSADPLCRTADADTLTCDVTGLTNGTAYTFTVRATNAVGTSAASAPSNSVTPAAPAASATPVPTLPLFGLGILVSLLGLFGLRKLRQ